MRCLDVDINDTLLTVYYDYTPAEAEVLYYNDGTGLPGSPPEVDIRKVLYKEQDVTELIDALGFEDEIKDQVFEYES